MKQYSTPIVKVINIQGQEPIGTLNSWLTDNGLEGAGITTYEILS